MRELKLGAAVREGDTASANKLTYSAQIDRLKAVLWCAQLSLPKFDLTYRASRTYRLHANVFRASLGSKRKGADLDYLADFRTVPVGALVSVMTSRRGWIDRVRRALKRQIDQQGDHQMKIHAAK